MRKIIHTAALTICVMLGLTSILAEAQTSRTYQRDDRQTAQLLTRIEERAARFQNTFKQAMNQGVNDSIRREQRLDQMINDFQQALSQLRYRDNRRQATDSDVRTLLESATRIDGFMQRRQLGQMAESDWRLLKADLERLARAYDVTWNWDTSDAGGPVGSDRLTGTYRLNQALSDNPRLIVERAVRSLPYTDRQRVTEALLRRLDAPDTLAIEQRGQSITLASSRAPQMQFDADGSEHMEQSPSGRTMRVVARVDRNQLTISTSGDRASDFTVTFQPINNGRQLRVERRLESDRLNEPIVVRSVYDQVSEVASWDIYRGQPGSPSPGPGNSYDFIVPEGTVLAARLNDDLDTNRARPGDRFRLTVVSPREYEGATIEGQVIDFNRSGRITGRAELALGFDSIRLRNGRSGRFEGTLESVQTATGERLRVDTEGTVSDSSQTNRTVTRSAIGTAVGAIIGAIAGGGKGAAIGAVVGAGAGAGTIIAEGRDDLRLTRGSEITIRASAPNRRAMR